MKFIFTKRNKEKINLQLPEGPSPSISTAKDEEIYYERANYKNNKYDLEDCFSTKSKQEKIMESIAAFEKKYEKILHQYSFIKLFYRAALKTKEYNEMTLRLDKQVNRFKKKSEDLKKKSDVLKYVVDAPDFELEQIFLKINELFDFSRDLDKQINQYKSAFFPQLKIASYSICNDQSYLEIDSLNKAVNKMIDEFKNIQEAYDFIVYNSGELIINTVNAFVNGLKNSKNQYREYDFHYFLNTDYIMTLKFPEWVELFTKILYVKRVVKDVELFDYLNFKNYYLELEKRYLIMLIYNEMGKR
ncbi:MAG: hypothetical protein PHX62_02330 [Bacilli bacterium]|nr:hypothetical protein [Bacilli bacterium]